MQKQILRAGVLASLLGFCLGSAAFSAVTRYPAPAPIRLSSDYTILADGLPIDVYAATTHLRDGKYSYAYFDFSGSVTVSIKSKFPFTNCRVLPLSSGVVSRVTGDSLEFTLDKPQDLSIEPNGPNSPLLLFTNPSGKGRAEPGRSERDLFWPWHSPGWNNQIGQPPDALSGRREVVKGAIEAHGVDITIGGRGTCGETIGPGKRDRPTIWLALKGATTWPCAM